MILYRWQGASTNFGDELNTILWPRLLPGFFDQNPAATFVGIGSVLDQRHAGPHLKIVAGAGYGGYEPRPRLDTSWIIHWVRGPRTAAALDLPASLALGDPAVLVPPALDLAASSGRDIGFLPHFESMARGAWGQVADLAGVTLIDPRGDPLDILRRIAGCRMVLSEALHGVIVADALRVPWIAIRPQVRIHRAKWSDWSDTMALTPRFASLPVSCARELPVLRRLAGPSLGPAEMIDRAAGALRRATRLEPQLSAREHLDRRQAHQFEAVDRLRRAPVANRVAAGGHEAGFGLALTRRFRLPA